MSGSSSSSSSSSSNSGGNTPTANHSHRADGCRSESNPGVYRRKGEVFFVGCDSKCVCTHSGVIQCEPRCSLFQGEYIKLLLFFDVLQYILNQKPHNNIRGETKTSSTNLRHWQWMRWWWRRSFFFWFLVSFSVTLHEKLILGVRHEMRHQVYIKRVYFSWSMASVPSFACFHLETSFASFFFWKQMMLSRQEVDHSNQSSSCSRSFFFLLFQLRGSHIWWE
jgi:hypothetical protein